MKQFNEKLLTLNKKAKQKITRKGGFKKSESEKSKLE